MSARLHHRLDGPEDAHVLVLSNSLGSRHTMWDAQAPALVERFRLLRYDQRGHGQSDVPDGPYSIADLAGDLLALLDELGIERVHLCGLSIGGMTGTWLGINARERIDRLVLSNTAAYFPPAEEWTRRAKVARSSEGVAGLADAALDRWFTPSFQERRPEEVERFRQMLITTAGEGYAGCCEAIREMDMRDGLGAIEAPTLVIAGEEDPSTPPDWNRELAEAIPDAEFHLLQDASHLSNVARPQEYTDLLLRHLGES
ncbi:MAG TPA: 3-oxoadipate enol-lactonase [Thermoleophilaceae bacterium]|nr:3-oxoadipate enol-lactonase [Thermoleophilaceae bacterium]